MHVLRKILLPFAALSLASCLFYPVPEDPRAEASVLYSLLGSGSSSSASSSPGPLGGRFFDINGDGFHDLLIGDEVAGSGAGRALIYNGSASGITSYSVGAGGTGADTILLGTAGSALGRSVTLGDIDGDGYADAIVGADNHNSNRGAVYIFYSQGSGGIASQDLQSGGSAGTTLTGENGGDQFGDFVEVGDYNGDGYADVLTGARSFSPGGRIYVFFGSASGIASGGAGGADTILTGSSNNRLSAVGSIEATFGDVNGDGFDDIHVCSLNLVGPVFDVISFYSTGTAGSVDLGAGGAPDATIGGSLVLCAGGVSLGDVNGDNYADLLTSNYDLGTSDGEAYVFLSSGAAGITATSVAQADTTLTAVTGSQCRFGVELTLADVNSDGLSDALVGARTGATCTPEYYYMFHSNGSGITSQDFNTGGSADSVLGEAGGGFVGRVGAGDFDGDGFYDLVTTRATAGGFVWIFYGTANGIQSGDSSSAGTTLSNVSSSDIDVPR